MFAIVVFVDKRDSTLTDAVALTTIDGFSSREPAERAGEEIVKAFSDKKRMLKFVVIEKK